MEKIDHFKAFTDYLSQSIPLEVDEIEFLQNTVPIKKYGKGEFLLQAGQISKEFFFNCEGFVRLYYLQEGEEKTAYFYGSNCFISAYSSFMRQKPATFFLQATEDTFVASISIESSEKILAFSSKFESLARLAMEEEMISLQEIIASLLTLRPEERYAEMLTKTPEVFQKVPQLQIASYLGVKPESLSRIKKRFKERS